MGEICCSFLCFDLCPKFDPLNGKVFKTFRKESQFERQECKNEVFYLKLREQFFLMLQYERTEILMADDSPDSCVRKNGRLKYISLNVRSNF